LKMPQVNVDLTIKKQATNMYNHEFMFPLNGVINQ